MAGVRGTCQGFTKLYAERTMYTIKQAAARSKVSIPLLRAWERRYGIVEPARTAAGYRLYDEAALDRIRTMRHLIEAGWAPSTAAAAILSGEAVTMPSRPQASEHAGAGRPDASPAEVLVNAFLGAAIALDIYRIEDVLDEMFATGSFETVADDLVMPALEGVGDAWADGRVGVAGEHAASHAVLRRLAAAFQAAGHPASAESVILVGLPPTVRHELGALAFSTAARRAGLPILYLGPDLPVDDWVATARRTKAAAAVIGVLTPSDVRPAIAVVTALRAANPALTIVLGGRSADRAAAAMASAGGDSARWAPLVLPDPLREAVAALARALGRPA